MAELTLVEAVNDALHTELARDDDKGLLAAAIRDPDPVVVLEPKLVYRTSRGEVPDGEHVVPLGEARIAREGSDVTLIAYGAMVPVCEQAADAVDVSCEIVDI